MSANRWEGERVRLRGVDPADWEHFVRWDTDSEAQRHGWMQHMPKGTEGAKKFAQEKSAALPDGDNYFLIIETLDGTPVGNLNTHACDKLNRRFEYGISLEREHWAGGYAADALRVLFRFMFEERGYHKVNAWVYGFNDRSRRFHEKFGMVLEGRARETRFSGGVFHDDLLFGMTAAEFAALDGSPRVP